jgi:hypothetical protein
VPSRAGLPPRRHVAAALLAAAAAPFACSATRAASPSDASSSWIGPGDHDATPGGGGGAPGASAPTPSADPSAPPTPWELAREISTFSVASPRGRSQHFTGELEADVRINAAAGGYPALRGNQPLPPGAVFLAAHYLPGSAEVVVLLAMVKRPPGYDSAAGDWEYLILTPTGEATHRGRIALCQRCHAEAPRDHLFGRLQ